MTSHEDAHKYSHMPDRSSSYQFPVALSGISPTDTNWSSLFAEPDEVEEEMTPDTHVMLHSFAEHDWNEVLVRLFQVANLLPWQLFVAATILVNYFYISYVNHFVLDTPPPRLFTEMYFTDLVYLADLALTVTPGFLKTVQDKMSFTKRSRLAVFTDVFTLLPLEQTYYFAVRRDAITNVLYLLRSITFIRGYRIVVYFQQWGRTAGSSHWKIFLAKYFLYLSVVVHMVTCVWFSLGCKHDCHRLAGLDEQLSQLDSWIYIVGSFTLSIKTAAQWYFVCFYFSLVTIANCGLGDLHATNRYEMLTCIVAMWAGFALIIGVYVGSLTSHLVNKTRRRALFSEKLHAINNYLTDIKMDLGPQREILKYYEVMWKKKKGIKSATEVDLLPLPLQMEVFFDINIARFVSSLIFCGQDESFLRRLSLYMKNEFYLPGETVYYQDVAKPKMVCISSGVLEVLSDEDGESPIISLTTGTCLGEVALGLTVPAKSSVRAATYTELQVLYKVDFLRMMADYPEIHRNIRELIKLRYVSAYDKEISTNKNEVLISLFVSQTREVTPIKNLKDNLRKSQGLLEDDRDDHVEFNPIISDTSPYRYLYVIAGKNSNREYQTTYLTKTLPWIIHPGAQILVVWEYVMFVTILFISIAYPYYCAFERKFPEWLSNTCILVDVLFVVDIFLQCTTAVEEKEVFLTNPMHIIDYRLNSPGLYLDVFAIFPIEVMAYMITPAKRGERIYWVLKLNRLLKSWRIPAFFYNHEKDLWASLVFMRIVKYILFFALCAHWAGVLLYMEACFYGYCDQESWFAANMDLEIDNRDKSPAYVSPCVVSIYFALSLLSGVGLGDFLPESNPDVCFTCFYIVLGVLLFGYCIAEFSATFTHISRTRVEYHSIVVAIKKFMEGNSLGSAIMDRVLNYYQLQWNYNGGVSVVQDNPLLADASYEIQRQVLAQECIVTLQSVPLFQHVNADFVQLVATSARVLVLPPNEIITYAGGLSREMYVVQEGFCEIISGNTGLTESLVGPNSHFGDIEMLHGIPSLVNVRTVTHCKVISIDYASYAQVISMFPHILKENESVMNIFNIKEIVKNSKFSKFSDRKKPYFPEKNKLNWRKGLNFHNFKYNIGSIFEGSFVDVRTKCRENGEEYYSPFDSLRKWRFIKFLLLPYCVSPNGNFIKVYCIVRTIAAIVVGFIQPFHQSIMPFDLNIDGLVMLLDIIAYLDLYVCMHVGYFNEMGVLVTHPLYTAKHYLQHNFVIDLLACFPFSYVIYSLQSAEDEDDESPANTFQNVAHLNVVLQLYRLPLGVQYLEGNILQKADIIRVFKYVIPHHSAHQHLHESPGLC
ncbi:unnamed protein product [Timema podura]|uniref:Cyclic nucleotide-binding domain-containing protein n=1 Tax=Timema podura TaxID=61482 RepID=A0ABN7P3S8_TIMPD|nr:unnamed protein product [Timema podura]